MSKKRVVYGWINRDFVKWLVRSIELDFKRYACEITKAKIINKGDIKIRITIEEVTR